MTGNAIFQFFKTYITWTGKVKIAIIDLDLYFVISNNILKFEKLWLDGSWVNAKARQETPLFQTFKNHNSWTVKVQIVIIWIDFILLLVTTYQSFKSFGWTVHE